MGIEVLYIALAGALGAGCRYLVIQLIEKFYKKKFPLPVFIINVLGCFIIGIFSSLAPETKVPHDLILSITNGFCGGFSTFSTFVSQTVKLGTTHEYLLLALNLLCNNVFGFLFCYFGELCGKSIK